MLMSFLLLAVAAAAAAAATGHTTSGSSGILEYLDPHCEGRQVIVQLFEWKWTDVARECEDYLGPYNFCGVQVSPPNEHALVSIPVAPWWQRYQPVSYKLQSRSGSEDQFLDMVKRCMAAGVRVYVDAVFNNMVEVGRWGTGSAGSNFDSDFRDFPGVPYGPSDFHDGTTCHSKETVKELVRDYLNRLITMGVPGFRIDLAKFMWPRDLEAIQIGLTDLPESGRPFIYHHVEDYGNDAIKASEYAHLGYVTNFQYGQSLAEAMAQGLQNLHRVQGPIHDVIPSRHALVFVDNHETQRKTQVGSPQLSFKDPKLYTMATAFTLAYNYGFVKLMSSYNFSDPDSGPPNDATAQSTKNVTILADGTCAGGWVCEHRWPAIARMVHFRNKVNGTDLRHWIGESEFVAFSRGEVGFFAMTLNQTYVGDVKTALPPGRYCELLSQCNQTVTVDDHGSAHLDMDEDFNPIIAVLSDWPAPDNTATDNVTWASSATLPPLPLSSHAEQTARPSASASWTTPVAYATDLNINPSPTRSSGSTGLQGYGGSVPPILPTRTLPPTVESHYPSEHSQHPGFLSHYPDLHPSAQSYNPGIQSSYPYSPSEYPGSESYYPQLPSHYPSLESSARSNQPGVLSHNPSLQSSAQSDYLGIESQYPNLRPSAVSNYPGGGSSHLDVQSHYPGSQAHYSDIRSSSQSYNPGFNSYYQGFHSSAQFHYPGEHSAYQSLHSHYYGFQTLYSDLQTSSQPHDPGFQTHYPYFPSSMQSYYSGEHSYYPSSYPYYPGFQSHFENMQSSTQSHYTDTHSYKPGFQSYYSDFPSSTQSHYPGEHSYYPSSHSHYPEFQSHYTDIQSSSQLQYTEVMAILT